MNFLLFSYASDLAKIYRSSGICVEAVIMCGLRFDPFPTAACLDINSNTETKIGILDLICINILFLFNIFVYPQRHEVAFYLYQLSSFQGMPTNITAKGINTNMKKYFPVLFLLFIIIFALSAYMHDDHIEPSYDDDAPWLRARRILSLTFIDTLFVHIVLYFASCHFTTSDL